MNNEKFSDYKSRPTELIGRKVKEHNRYRQCVKTIERVTATQIVLIGGMKINYQGNAVGERSAWSSLYYALITDEEAENIIQANKDTKEKYSLEKWLEETKFTLDQLRKIKTLIENE
jgi:hypothetical protein